MTDDSTSQGLKNEIFKATLAAGCYWCLEAMFSRVKGIENVASGFSGGITDNPTYESVCKGNTGHAEVIYFDYDPDIISYVEILKIFFTAHNPTTLNQQGNDIGTQYRSAVFFHDNFQRMAVEEIIKYLEKEHIWENIVTEINPFETFYPAPKEHDNYYDNNPNASYCSAVIEPKLNKFVEVFSEMMKT